MTHWCSRDVCGDGVMDQRQGEVNIGGISHLDLEPIGASRSQADSVIRLELRAASANLSLGQSDVEGVFIVEVSDFSFANPQSGAGPEGSFRDHETIELGGAIQEGFSPVAHPDIVS
jgi:hypothetical protein